MDGLRSWQTGEGRAHYIIYTIMGLAYVYVLYSQQPVEISEDTIKVFINASTNKADSLQDFEKIKNWIIEIKKPIPIDLKSIVSQLSILGPMLTSMFGFSSQRLKAKSNG